MSVVMEISDHVVVLEYGRKISDGTPEHVKSDPKVIAAYLGVDDEERSRQDCRRRCLMSQPLLQVENVETYYGNIRALGGVTVTANAGEIVTLIGANGAGKSTSDDDHLRQPTGAQRSRHLRRPRHHPHADSRNRPAAHCAVARGPAHFPAHDRVFENLQMGASLDNQKYFDEDVKRIFALFPRLEERQYQRGGTLSGGEQQMLSSRSRADGAAEAPASRRAVAGSRPPDLQADLRSDRQAQQDRRASPSSSSSRTRSPPFAWPIAAM